MKEILQTNFTMKDKYQKVPLIKLFTDIEAFWLNAIADIGNSIPCLSSLKDLPFRISGRDSFKGGGL
jgi:hypothetical protein